MNTGKTNHQSVSEGQWFTDDPAYNLEGHEYWVAHRPVSSSSCLHVEVSKGILIRGCWYLAGDPPANLGERCVIGVASLTEQKPTYSVKAGPGQYLVEVFIDNPADCVSPAAPDNLVDCLLLERCDLAKQARHWWLAGYWIEIFNDEGELVSGPIDPEAPFPSPLF